MNFSIVIPCHNEEAHIGHTLESLLKQSYQPSEIVVVNDQSSDRSQEIVSAFAKAHTHIKLLNIEGEDQHLPGSKVINAFQKGLESLAEDYDIICKFDADLIFPPQYLEKLKAHFEAHPKNGMVGGFCYIQKNGSWELENLTNKDHIRGALKAYRKDCFMQIGGLKAAMGWDTIDELLARYHGWQIKTDESLHVKHLKPTGQSYNKASKFKQGEAFYRMRYGFWITFLASAKLAKRKGSLIFFIDCLSGYFRAKRTKSEYLVSDEEGRFIRQLRWKGIRRTLLGGNS